MKTAFLLALDTSTSTSQHLVTSLSIISLDRNPEAQKNDHFRTQRKSKREPEMLMRTEKGRGCSEPMSSDGVEDLRWPDLRLRKKRWLGIMSLQHAEG